MSYKENFEYYKQTLIDENERKYGAEIREKYGNQAVDESNNRLKGLTQEQHDESERLRIELEETLIAAFESGDPAGEMAQRACDLHRQWLCIFYPNYTKAYHQGLGEMYVTDERFKAYYEKLAPGCSEFLRDAIDIYCGAKYTIMVRQAKAADCDGVERFYSDLIESMRNSEFAPEWEMGVYPTKQLLKDAITEQSLFLAYLDNNLVGAMILNHDCEPGYENVKWLANAKKNEVMVIHLLAVAAAYQGRGIARQMVAKAIEMAKNNSLIAIRLDVLIKNTPAAKLYTSMGFKYIDSVKIYYEDTGLADFQLYELIL